MPEDHLARFHILIVVGLGLLLAGAVNLTLRHASPGRRVLVVVLAGGAVLLGCRVFVTGSAPSWPSAGLLAAALTPCLILGTYRGAAALSAVAAAAARPALHWGAVAGVGLVVVLGSVIWFEQQDDAAIDAGMIELELLTTSPLYQRAPVRLATDRGTPVSAWMVLDPRPADEQRRIEQKSFEEKWPRDFVIHRGPGDDHANCFGWVFADGRYWLDQTDMPAILAENGYREPDDPRPGDLAIYRSQNRILHTAVVRYVTRGMPVLVEGKWGYSGVYLHPIDKSPYGATVTYLRSPRTGHRLAGLEAAAGAQSGHPQGERAETE